MIERDKKRELLEKAAKAAGMDGYEYVPAWGNMAKKDAQSQSGGFDASSCWDPLESDADAFRLAVQFRLTVEFLCEPEVIRLEIVKSALRKSDEIH